jgi:hypothetical protein
LGSNPSRIAVRPIPYSEAKEPDMELKERNDVQPKCPHCQQTILELWFRELKSVLGKRYVYFCPSCTSVVGVSHRKGFFMG